MALSSSLMSCPSFLAIYIPGTSQNTPKEHPLLPSPCLCCSPRSERPSYLTNSSSPPFTPKLSPRLWSQHRLPGKSHLLVSVKKLTMMWLNTPWLTLDLALFTCCGNCLSPPAEQQAPGTVCGVPTMRVHSRHQEPDWERKDLKCSMRDLGSS